MADSRRLARNVLRFSENHRWGNCYEGTHGVVYHADMYRIRSSAEAESAGLREILASGETVIIEWPERIEELLDERTIRITIHVQSESERRIAVSGELAS